MRTKNQDSRTAEEKLAEVDDLTELFVFLKYYDGYSTAGEIGFSMNSGPPASTTSVPTQKFWIIGVKLSSATKARTWLELPKLASKMVSNHPNICAL
jgi:hypothetical protein